MMTSYLLSPLDLIRTRLILQSVQPRHRKYSGPVDALRTISQEEGGLRMIYTHPNLVFPGMLDSCLRSFFHLSIPLFIERRLHISPDASTIIYGSVEFVLSTAALLFTLPIETVRKRMQVQSRAVVTGLKGRRSYKACVETRPGAYVGVVEAVYRILTEETGQLHLQNANQKLVRPSMSRCGSSQANSRRSSYQGQAQREATDSAQQANLATQAGLAETAEGPAKMPLFSGVTQLFRGFSMGMAANLLVLVLGLVAGKDDPGTGWAEI